MYGGLQTIHEAKTHVKEFLRKVCWRHATDGDCWVT